jgi:hypothetical protein
MKITTILYTLVLMLSTCMMPVAAEELSVGYEVQAESLKVTDSLIVTDQISAPERRSSAAGEDTHLVKVTSHKTMPLREVNVADAVTGGSSNLPYEVGWRSS